MSELPKVSQIYVTHLSKIDIMFVLLWIWYYVDYPWGIYIHNIFSNVGSKLKFPD